MKKLAIYLRTSTDEQDKGLASQEHAIKQWCKNHNYKKSQVVFYRDKGKSGKDLKRPAFEKLQSAIFKGEHDTVVCWALNRLSRSQKDGINLLHEWLDKEIRIVSISQQFDWSGDMGKMLAGVFFAIGEWQLKELSDATKRGIERAREQGKQIGGSKAGVPKKAKPDKVTAILSLRQKGKTIKAIAEVVGLHRETVSKILKREAA